MYWIYLSIFILIIFTPKVIQGSWLFFQEEDLEALIIFGFGALGFFLYLAKEKELLRAFKEKLHLQKQANIITRDLSDSYSYIGEMNRKFDIVKDIIFELPQEATDTLAHKKQNIYGTIMDAVCLLAKADQAALRFVNVRTQVIEKSIERGSVEAFTSFNAETLVRPKKLFWEEEGCIVACSPKAAADVMAFIIFPKNQNRVEDAEVFKILAAEALFLFSIERGSSSKS